VDAPLLNKAGKVYSKERIFDGLFEAILTRYEEEFRSEETHRDVRFNEAESARDFADSERSRLFLQHESTRSAEFAQVMVLRGQQFDTLEKSRNAREGWRKDRFEGGMERRSWLFKQAQTQQDEKMYSVLNFVEEEFVQAMKERIKKLVRTQQQLFEEARERRSVAFTRSQIQRETELGTFVGEAATISGKTPFVGIPPNQPPALHPIAFPLSPYARTASVSCGSSWMQPYLPSVAPPEISPPHQKQSWYTNSPQRPTWLSPHHHDWHLPLSMNDVINELSRQEPDAFETQFFNDEHGTRHLTFARSRTEWRRQFEDGMYRRQCTFLINERIRDENFESEQRNRTNMSFSAEKERDTSFLHSQQERERKFCANEAMRTSIFCEEEAQRVAADLEAQKMRGELFDALQDKLQKQCSEDEARRNADFEAWALALLQERKQKQVDGYKDEERVREETFVRSLN